MLVMGWENNKNKYTTTAFLPYLPGYSKEGKKCWYNWLPVCQCEAVGILGGVGKKALH